MKLRFQIVRSLAPAAVPTLHSSAQVGLRSWPRHPGARPLWYASWAPLETFVELARDVEDLDAAAARVEAALDLLIVAPRQLNRKTSCQLDIPATIFAMPRPKSSHPDCRALLNQIVAPHYLPYAHFKSMN